MKTITSISIGFIVAGCLLASGAALARKGGIPQCEETLLQCDTDLTQCAIDLAICETTGGQAFPVTGQTSCWDSDANLLDSCDGTGHDGDIQAGATLAYTDNNDGTITDENTGLTWMKQDDNDGDCASLPGSLDKDCPFTWDEAFTFVAEQLNAAPCFAGHCDWRVPNVKELQSIVNYENFGPAVSAEFNIGCVADCTVETCSCTAWMNYWSSTSVASGPGNAWGITFFSGNVPFDGKSNYRRVRAVRGGL